MISLFSLFLLTEGASAEEASKATSRVGIRFYGEYPKTEGTIANDKPKGQTILPSTGESLSFFTAMGLAVLGSSIFLYKKIKKSEETN